MEQQIGAEFAGAELFYDDSGHPEFNWRETRFDIEGRSYCCTVCATDQAYSTLVDGDERCASIISLRLCETGRVLPGRHSIQHWGIRLLGRCVVGAGVDTLVTKYGEIPISIVDKSRGFIVACIANDARIHSAQFSAGKLLCLHPVLTQCLAADRSFLLFSIFNVMSRVDLS